MQDWRWLTMHRFRAEIFSMNEFKMISRTLFASEFLISTLLPDFLHVEVVFWKILFFSLVFCFHFWIFFVFVFQYFWFFNFFVLSFCFFNDVFSAAILKILMKINFFQRHGFEGHIKIARLLMKTGRFEWSIDLKKLLFWKNYLRNWSKFSF